MCRAGHHELADLLEFDGITIAQISHMVVWYKWGLLVTLHSSPALSLAKALWRRSLLNAHFTDEKPQITLGRTSVVCRCKQIGSTGPGWPVPLHLNSYVTQWWEHRLPPLPRDLVLILQLLFIGCVTTGSLFLRFEPQFHHLCNGDDRYYNGGENLSWYMNCASFRVRCI